MPVSNRVRCIGAVLASLLVAGAGGWRGSVQAAELLEIRLEGLRIPINLRELEGWISGQNPDSDLSAWMNLLEPSTRNDLRGLLQAPLLQNRSFGKQLLDSWAGVQVVSEVGALLTDPDGRRLGPQLERTVTELLDRRGRVSSIDLLLALPVRELSLRLDGLLALADQGRRLLLQQRQALSALQTLGLPLRESLPLSFSEQPLLRPERLLLVVPHRREGLPLEIWVDSSARSGSRLPMMLLMPGLGGNSSQLAWLAGALAGRGWPVVVLQHPGSDDEALRDTLDGLRAPPGAETLRDRLSDVAAVLGARRQGTLPVSGEGVVLMGHSLGGLSALLAAGIEVEPALERRCARATDRLPIANPSQLLQCQLPALGLPALEEPPEDLRGVVVFNGFGSLLWPGRGLAELRSPLLLVGGSLDLITPPLSEQLDLFLPAGDRRSRLVLVEGASHFSLVRLPEEDAPLFRLGGDLVGVEPMIVQALILRLTTEFLMSLEQPQLLQPQRRRQQGVTAHVLDEAAARRWGDLIR